MRDSSWLKTARCGVYVEGSCMSLREGTKRGLLLAGFSDDYVENGRWSWEDATNLILDTLNSDLEKEGRDDVVFSWDSGDLVLQLVGEEDFEEDFDEETPRPLAKLVLGTQKVVIDVVGGITVIEETEDGD